jgi:1-acyl-sn-glycerol-3-phosphate acyltransferase
VAALALSGDFPVIPVAHWGTNHVYRSYGEGRRFTPLPRKDVHVVAGEPIDLSAWRGKPIDNRAIRDVSYLIMGRIREMVAQLRDETAPEPFFNPKTGHAAHDTDTRPGAESAT